MFSNDRNVETIAQLVEVLKNYVGLQKEYLKLDVIEKVVRLSKALIIAIVFLILIVAVLFYLSFAIIHWMEPLTGLGLAYFLMAMAYFVLMIVIFLFRKSWIERPLVRFLADILFN